MAGSFWINKEDYWKNMDESKDSKNSNNRIQQNLHKLKNTINFFVHTLYLYI